MCPSLTLEVLLRTGLEALGGRTFPLFYLTPTWGSRLPWDETRKVHSGEGTSSLQGTIPSGSCFLNAMWTTKEDKRRLKFCFILCAPTDDMNFLFNQKVQSWRRSRSSWGSRDERQGCPRCSHAVPRKGTLRHYFVLRTAKVKDPLTPFIIGTHRSPRTENQCGKVPRRIPDVTGPEPSTDTSESRSPLR